MAILEGAESLLQNGIIDVIQFEYNHRWIAAGRFLRDAFTLFRRHGYCLGKVTPRGVEFYDHWDSELESFREANYLACRPELKSDFPSVAWWNAGVTSSPQGSL